MMYLVFLPPMSRSKSCSFSIRGGIASPVGLTMFVMVTESLEAVATHC